MAMQDATRIYHWVWYSLSTLSMMYMYIILIYIPSPHPPPPPPPRFTSGADSFQPPNGRKWVEGLRNCKGTWHARRMHMTKQSQVTFHGHHFKAIMGFIMHGYAPRWAFVQSTIPAKCTGILHVQIFCNEIPKFKLKKYNTISLFTFYTSYLT